MELNETVLADYLYLLPPTIRRSFLGNQEAVLISQCPGPFSLCDHIATTFQGSYAWNDRELAPSSLQVIDYWNLFGNTIATKNGIGDCACFTILSIIKLLGIRKKSKSFISFIVESWDCLDS